MSACEICWSKAWTRATGSGRPVDEVYREVLAETEGWPPRDAACGGIEVNGKPWTWCEVHMLPRGHKHGHGRIS